MPTVNLFPSSTVSNNWPEQDGTGSAHTLLASASDSGIRTPDQNDSCIVELDNYAAGGTINSIQIKTLAYVYLTRSASFDIRIQLIDGSGGSVYYNEDVTIAFNGYTPTAADGTVRTTSDGSSAWTGTQLNNLRLGITTDPADPPSISRATVTYAYVVVDYTAASGYANTVNGIIPANIGKINEIATASISKVNGI